MMNRKDIFKRLGMSEFYWGDAFEIETVDQDISTAQSRLSLLDEICRVENLTILGTRWNEVTYQHAEDLLTKALTYDLAYSSSLIAPTEKVEFLKSEILTGIDDRSAFCYINWTGSPWSKERGGCWNPLTPNTFDMGIVFLSEDKLIFVYFISED